MRTSFTLALLTLLALIAGVSSNALPVDTPASHFDFKASYTRSSYYIPMRDGIRLYTTVYAPKDESCKWPFLMLRTPYGIDPYTPGDYTDPDESLLPMLREGYIMVEQDVRGRYFSEGEFDDVKPMAARVHAGNRATDESTDTYDTIEWLIKSIPNNNGRVGVWGISYPGFYAAAAGNNSHPALRAIAPQAPVSDWFMGDDDHHNGCLFLMDTVRFFNDFGRPRSDKHALGDNYLPQADLHIGADAYKYYLVLGPLKNVDANYFRGEIQHWTDIINHPDFDSFWQARSLPLHLKNVRCPTLFVGGWYDAEDKYGPVADWEAVKRDGHSDANSLVIGPWSHGGWSGGDGASFGDETFGINTSRWFRERLYKLFFDYYLKDKGGEFMPGVTVYSTGINQFWRFSNWPPAGSRPTSFYLASNHALTTHSASKDVAREFDTYVSDPANPVPYDAQTPTRRRSEYLNDDQRFASARPDVLTYQSEPLPADTTIAGKITADLRFSATGTDADFIVKVIDVAPDSGYQRMVRADVMRTRWRESFSKPIAITPGKTTQVTVNLNDVCHTFFKGHRIMVQVQSSWFPLVDRNPQTFVPNIYKADEKDFQKETIRIFHSSRVVLPVLESLPRAIPVEEKYLSAHP